MPNPLVGTSTYVVWCRYHGAVGQYTVTDDANAACYNHFQGQHIGHGRDQTAADNTVATLAEIYISTVQRVVPADTSAP